MEKESEEKSVVGNLGASTLSCLCTLLLPLHFPTGRNTFGDCSILGWESKTPSLSQTPILVLDFHPGIEQSTKVFQLESEEEEEEYRGRRVWRLQGVRQHFFFRFFSTPLPFLHYELGMWNIPQVCMFFTVCESDTNIPGGVDETSDESHPGGFEVGEASALVGH